MSAFPAIERNQCRYNLQIFLHGWIHEKGKHTLQVDRTFSIFLKAVGIGIYRKNNFSGFAGWADQGFRKKGLISSYPGLRDKTRKIRLETTLSRFRGKCSPAVLMGIALPIPSHFHFCLVFRSGRILKMAKMVCWLHSTCDRSAEGVQRMPQEAAERRENAKS